MADRTVVVRFVAQVSQARSQVNTLGRDYTRFGNTVATQSQRAGQSAKTLAQMSAQAGKMILIGIGGALAVSAKAALDFESSFAGIRKTVDTSEKGFAALAQEMRDLAKIIPVNVNELNRIGEVAGQLGIEAQNIASFTKTIAMIGATTTLSTEAASIGFARLSNILQVPQAEIGRLGSVIVELGNNFATTEDQILNFALRVAPIGATVGLTADNVLALATAFSSVGVPAERGGTAVQRVFATMAEAVLDGQEDLESFADTAGMAAEEFADLFDVDPAQGFNQFIIGLRRIIDEGGNAFATLRQVGITSQRTMQAILGLASAEDLLTESLSMAEQAMADNDALTEEFQKRVNTGASQLQLLANAFYDLRIELGEKLLPSIVELTQVLTYLVNSMGQVDGSAVKTTASFASMFAAGGLLLSLGKKLVTGFKSIGAAMKVTGAVAGTVAGALVALGVGWAALKIGEIIKDNIVWKQKVQDLTDAYKELNIAIAEGIDTQEAEDAIADVIEGMLGSDAVLAFEAAGIPKGVLMEHILGDDQLASKFLFQQMRDLRHAAAAAKDAYLFADPDSQEDLHALREEWELLQNRLDLMRATLRDVGFAMTDAMLNGADAAAEWEHFLVSIGRHDFEPDALTMWGEAFQDFQTEARKAAVEASNFWDVANDETITESIDKASNLVDAIVTASNAYNDLKSAAEPTIDQAQTYARAMADIERASQAAGDDGIQPLIAEYERMYMAGLLTRQETDNFINSLNQLPTAADAYEASLARMRLQTNLFSTSIYQAALLALDFARIASFEARLAGAADLFSGAVSSAGGAVAKSAEDIASDAANAFLSTLQADLSYRQAQKALEDVKKAIADLAKEREEVWRNIIDLNARIRKARIEAEQVTLEEQVDIMRAQLDLLQDQWRLADMRQELAGIDQELAEADEALADALEHYNDEMERSIRVGIEHEQRMTSAQSALLEAIRAYGMGEGSFADMVNAQAALAEELINAGDAAGIAEDAEEDLADAQSEHAETIDEILRRRQELTLEIALAEKELILAQQELIQLQKDAVGPTQELLDLEEELKEAKERLTEIIEEQEDAIWDLESAQYDLIAAYMNLQTATSELAKNKDAQRYFQDVAREAGIAEGAVRSLMALIGSPAGSAALNPPPAAPPPSGPITLPPSTPPPVVPEGPWYDPLAVFGDRPVLGEGGFIMTPQQHTFPAILHGQEAVVPLDRLEKMLGQDSGGGDTIVVNLGNEEIANFVVDEVLDKAARQTRVARRVS